MTLHVPNSTRLKYRLMTPDDIDSFLELDSDAEVMKYINGGKPTTRDAFIQNYVPRLTAFTHPEKAWGMWQASTIEESEFLGWVLVRPMGFFGDNPDHSDIELGWRFKRSTWGNGYGTEAARAILQALSTQLNYRTFTSVADKRNAGSINIMRKLGMTFVSEGIESSPMGDIEAVTYQLTI